MPDLGKKHECSECGAKFYDLGKADPACPRCGAAVSGEEEPKVKPKRKRKTPAVAKPTPPAKDETFDEDGGDELADDLDDSDDDDLDDEEDLDLDLDDEDLDDDEEEDDDDED